MDEYQVIVPAPSSLGGYVELSRSRDVRGTKFRKHILTLGTLIHPKTGERLVLDEPWYDRLKSNFDRGVCDIVQVPLADENNRHTEDPLRNSGEVVGMGRDGKKVWVDLDIRDPKVTDGLRNRTLIGASAFLNLDYTDTSTGQRVGPALMHSCITNRPYVTGLDDYQEVVAATADGEGDVIVLGQEEQAMTKEELLEALKSEHGIDVTALQEAVAKGNGLSELTATLTQALAGTPQGQQLQLSGQGGTVGLSDVVGAIAELAGSHKALDDKVTKLTRENAEAEVDGYIDKGLVLPKQKAVFVRLAMEDRDQMAVLLPDERIVPLNDVSGVQTATGEGGETGTDIDAELARLTSQPATKAFFEATPAGPARNGHRPR